MEETVAEPRVQSQRLSLAQQASALTKSINELKENERVQHRRRIATLFTGAVVAALLIFMIGIGLSETKRLTNVIDQREKDRLVADFNQCVNSNQARADLVELDKAGWAALIEVSRPPPTPEEAIQREATIKKLYDLLQKSYDKFAPRDCSKLTLPPEK